ncbi:light-harvesting complex-like protein OHP1, chloroplastic [Mercurialis annua]|uniref:light-harvesting complex-like protein OHP1, chloroplastic n=1 Tax=Mercurialis annua TaxID=3986 RepID=UPI00215E2A82|nr:light-harvesting complex-like protein OHP1, chloroplastic [Mercurialis annua]
MATMPSISSSLLPTKPLTFNPQNRQVSLYKNSAQRTRIIPTKPFVRAAKLPPGVELPKVQPKFEAPFLGFTKTAEVWNSRACMIGLIGTFIVELILNKGILQLIGVEIGKGLDLPL